tara:strand:+ start:1098 stop:1862 length:765 start_codon:yes stop_codon:yes gene_type:complete
MNSVKKLYNDFLPGDVYIAWDSKLKPHEKSFRRSTETYKSTRDKSKWEDVYEHEKTIREMCKLIGVCNIHPGSLEADDVIYYLSKKLKPNIVISSDHDLLQTITDDTCVYNPVSKVTYNNKTFESLIPVPIELYVKYKALIGDKSDNIPGIKGVGPKTAVKYLNEGIKESLSSEDYDIFLENMKLVDLSTATSNHPGEEQIYEYQLISFQDNDQSNFDKFKEMCQDVNYPEKSISKFDIFFQDEINNALLSILK